MAINGIETLLYGVDDVVLCTRFFEDFGLQCSSKGPNEAAFELEEGSQVVLRSLHDSSIPTSSLVGPGVKQVIWGVDSPRHFDRLIADLSRDRPLSLDSSGTAHFLSDCGLPLGLKLFNKRPVTSAPDALNAPGVVNRLNTHRKWRLRARPKTLQHVVFTVKDFNKSFAFFRDRMGFRPSDYQKGFGIYARCDGTRNHHNLFLLNADLPFPGFDGQPRFHHTNFGVEDLDEIMVGANHMERCGWPKSHLGLGRHRIDSALFFYIPAPTGGEAEYGADADYVDDSWVPRLWENPLFGYLSFAHNLPPFMMEPPSWDVRYHEDHTPPRQDHHG